jgi:hypothetical protein
MKFKTLAAAALAVVAASQAHADIQVTSGGNSELFFVLGNDKGSFLLDTGITLNALKSASFTSYVQNVTGLAGFSDFAAGTTPQWALAVYDGLGTANFNQRDLISTRASTLVTPAAINNTTFKNSTNNFVGSIAQQAVTTGTHSTLANGSSYNPVATAGYFGSTFFNLNQSTDQIGNAVGTASTLMERQGTGTTGNLTQTTVTMLTGYSASFDGTTLSISAPVAAIPEPSSYAMLAAGLAAVGFVARRRRA